MSGQYSKIKSRGLQRSARGQSLAEYALILALITLVCVAALTNLGGTLSGWFNTYASAMNNSAVSTSPAGGG